MRWSLPWRRELEEVRRAPDIPAGARPSDVDDAATDQARRFNRQRYRRGQSPPPTERDYSITCDLGGFGLIGVPWAGTSREDARDSFMMYLNDDVEFNDTGGLWPNYRSLYVRFNGQWRLLTFRTDWVAGFTVH